MNKHTEEKRVLFIARVSGERQGQGESDIPEQVRACHEFMKRPECKGWKLVKVIDDTKMSGFKTEVGERPDLQVVREMAVNGEIDILLCFHTNRLGRRSELHGLIMGLSQFNVELWSCSEGKQTSANQHGSEEQMESLMMFIKFWQYENESVNKSIAIKNTLDYLKERGGHFHGTPPYGYVIETTNELKRTSKGTTLKKVWVPDEEEAHVVREVFRLYVEEGWGTVKISQHLNEIHAPKKCKKKNQTSQLWRANAIHRILTNTAYIGRLRYNTQTQELKSKKKTFVPREEWKLQPYNESLRIIPDELFEKAQQRRASNTNKRREEVEAYGLSGKAVRSEVLLSGLVFCKTCGCRLATGYSDKKYTRKDGTVKFHRYRRYTCQEGRNFVGEHGKANWGCGTIDKKVEEAVLDVIDGLKFESVMDEVNKHKDEGLRAKERRIKEVEKELSKKNKAMENAEGELEKTLLGEGDFTKEQLGKLMNKLSEAITRLEVERTTLQRELQQTAITQSELEMFQDEFRNWKEVYLSSSLDGKKQMLSRIIHRVNLSPTGEAEIEFNLVIQSALSNDENILESTDLPQPIMDSSNKEKTLEGLLTAWALKPQKALSFTWRISA